MAIVSRPTGRGYSVYVDSETGNQISAEEADARISQSRAGLFSGLSAQNTSDSSFHSAGSIADYINNYDPNNADDLAGLYKANAYLGINPEKAARLTEAANILSDNDADRNAIMSSGMDDDTILKGAEAAARYRQNSPDDWEAFVQENPATAQYLSQQKNMAMSWDDISPLKKIEDTISSVRDHAELADLQERRAEIGMQLMKNDGAWDNISADQRAEIEDIDSRIKIISKKYEDPEMRWYNPLTWDAANIVGGLAGMKNDLFKGLVVGAGDAAIGAGVGAAAAGAGALPGAFIGFGKGFTAGMAYNMGYRAMGNAYLDNISKESMYGNRMDTGSAYAGAILSGIGNSVIGAGGIGLLMSRLPGGTEIFSKFTNAVPDAVLENPEATQAAWKLFAKNFIASTAEQSVIFGGGTKAVDIAAERTAEQLSGLNFFHGAEPSAVEQVLQATADFVPTAAVMGGGVSIVRPLMGHKATSETPTTDALKKIDDTVSESKTAQRSKDNIASLANAITKDSPVDDIGIPAQEFVRYWQEAMPDDPAAAVEQAAKLGVDESHLQEAVATGADINIKTADFVKEYAGTGHIEGLGPDVRLRADGFTDRELKGAKDQFSQEIQDMQDAAAGKNIDKESPAYQEAVNIARAAYPDAKERVIEQQANMTYAMFKRAEERGVLQANGYADAAEAMRAVQVERKVAPQDSAGLSQAAMRPENKRYVLTRDGELNYGGVAQDLTADDGTVVKKAPIRLQIGFHSGDRSTGIGAGLAHIQKHKGALEKAGYESSEEAIKDISSHYDFLYQDVGKDGTSRLHYVKRINEKQALDMSTDYSFDSSTKEYFYSPISISPMKGKQIEKAQQKALSFGGRQSPSIDSGADAFRSSSDRNPGTDKAVVASNESAFGTLNISDAEEYVKKYTVPDDRGKSMPSGKLFQDIDNPASGESLGSYVPQEMGKGIIELYQHANASTLPHEMMHHFVQLYKNAVDSGKASDDVIKDYRSLSDFVGAKDGEAWSNEQHEKVTSAFETYLSEGKAPSLELVGVFNKFKNWMLNIYRKLTRQAIPVSDEVRQVFDRMLAADDQISQAEAFYGSERLMGGREMGLAELKQYVSMLRKAHDEAQRTIYAKALADLRPDFKKRLQEFINKTTEDISWKMMSEPVYMARAAMEAPSEGISKVHEAAENIHLTEENPGYDFIQDNNGGLKLNREATEAQYGKGAVPDKYMTKNGKFTLDDIADIYGFKSGDELRQAVASSRDFDAELAKRVSDEVARFKENELGSLQDEAAKAVHNRYNLEAIAVEAEAIRKYSEDMHARESDKTAMAIARGKDTADQKSKIDAAVANEKEKGTAKIEAQKEKANEKLSAVEQKLADARETRRWDIAVQRGRLKAAAARQAAKESIANKTVAEAGNWRKYMAQSVKSGKESTRLMAKGDYGAALQAKDQELLNHALAMEAIKADREIKADMRFFNKIDKRGNKMKGLPHEFNRQIDVLLDKYTLLKRAPIEPLDPENILSLSQFVDDCKENYFYPQIPDSIINDTRPQHYSRLPLQQFRDLKEAVKSIQHVGRGSDRALADERAESMQERIDAIHTQIMKHKDVYSQDYAAGKRDLGIVDKLSRLADKTPFLVKMESYCRLIDRNISGGPAMRYLYQPVREALDHYEQRMQIVNDKFDQMVKEAGWTSDEVAKLAKDKKHFNFLPNDLTMEEIVQMALNWGNDGNRDRLRRGYFLEGWQKGAKLSEEDIRAIDSKIEIVLGSLDERHWKLVQGIWDFLDGYTDEVRQHELSITGVDPKMVDAKGFMITTHDGKYIPIKGGYYPIDYDPNKSIGAMKNDDAKSALYKMNPSVPTMTEHGHTKERVSQVTRPLNLGWSVLTDHLHNVEYDLALRKAIIDVNKLLNNQDIQSAISNTLGLKAHREMSDWLKYIASEQSEQLHGGEGIARWFRHRTTQVALGFRVKALIEDLPVNVIQSFWQNGVGETIRGMSDFYFNNWREQVQAVNAKSSMMAQRVRFIDRDINEFSKTLFSEKNLANMADRAKNFFYVMDTMADAAVTYPIWQRTYAKAITEGMSEKDAIFEADGVVRRTTADGSTAGLVRIQRGGEYTKLMTMFYTWYSGLFNRFWMSTKMAQMEWNDQQKRAAAETMLRAGLYGFFIPAVISGAVKGTFSNSRSNDPEKKKNDMLKNTLSGIITQPFGMIPGLGSAVSYGVNKTLGVYDSFSISPVESTIEKMVDVIPAIAKYMFNSKVLTPQQQEQAKMSTVKSTMDAAALIAGYPARVNIWVLNFYDYLQNHGDETVQGFISDLITRRHKIK